MKVLTYTAIIFLICLALGLYLGMYLQEYDIAFFGARCYLDSDCQWRITNCCPENAGATWDCVNTKTYKQPECPDMVICPQVLSPKPTTACACVEGNCIVR